MLKVGEIDTWGFKHAIRGMRNPYDSWDKSDSEFVIHPDGTSEYVIGPNDLALMQKLYKAGPEHRKYLRQIMVSFDITAPLYWWKEFDTYKVGTVANSCSTMHTIAKKEFTIEDFSCEHLLSSGDPKQFPLIGVGLGHNDTIEKNIVSLSPSGMLDFTITMLNRARQIYLETKDKNIWWQLIQLLPSSYNQKRTVTMNYENVVTILRQRKGHRLDEWKQLRDVLRMLPYITAITSAELEDDFDQQ